MTWTALPITSAGRSGRLGPFGIVVSLSDEVGLYFLQNLLQNVREIVWASARISDQSPLNRCSGF